MVEFTDRKRKILRLLVSDYIASAAPVGSETLAREHGLGVSPATVRNEMVKLEEDGYIIRPHSSAGGVPSDKGYRFFVERLPRNSAPPTPTRAVLQCELAEVRRDVEGWARAASSTVSQVVHTLAFASAPKAGTSRVKQLELLHLQDLTALLVVILHGAAVHKQLIPLERPATQPELERARNRLAELLTNRTAAEIEAGMPPTPDRLHAEVVDAVIGVLRAEEADPPSAYVMDGLAELFAQPEFSDPGQGREIVGALEAEGALGAVVGEAPSDGSVRVFIGSEIGRDSMQSFSVIVCRYGDAGSASGTVGIVGPKRLHYGRAIPVVRHTASLLSDLVADLFPAPTAPEFASARQ